jgi:hypothetical protein
MLGLDSIRRLAARVATKVRGTLAPAGTGVARGLVADLTRTRHQLMAENAFVREQLLIAARQVKKARFCAIDRALLVALAATFAHWRDALVLVKPER